MKSGLGLIGVLLLLKSLEGMLNFYRLIFNDVSEISFWIAFEGVIGTTIVFYFLMSIAKLIWKWISYVPEPE